MIGRMIQLGIGNPVLLNLIFLTALILGVTAGWSMPKEEFPRVSTDQVGVFVAWPGASPADLEDRVLRPIERALDEVDDVRHVYANAVESGATLQIEFERGTDADRARTQVERAVNGIGDLPTDAETPVVFDIALQVSAAHVALVGDPTQVDLADTLAEEVTALSGLHSVRWNGRFEPVVEVQLDRARASALGIGPTQVVAALRAANRGAPAGRAELDGQRVLVRTPRGIDDVQSIAQVPLLATGGVTIRLGQIARVVRSYDEPEIRYHVDGRPAIEMIVFQDEDADVLATVPRIQRWAAARDVPDGLQIVVYDDGSRILSDRLVILVNNGIAGGVLVFLSLWVFIGFRNSVLVVWGLPVAYGGALVAMYMGGVTINVISTFALLIVSGIIVDDAIIITENVQRHLEMGKSRAQAALDGTVEVFGSVFSATLTTVAAFAPLLMLTGTVGQVMAIVPTVVIVSLAASLLEAFFILPGHLAHYASQGSKARENVATRWLKIIYRPVLHSITSKYGRYLTAIGVCVVMVAVFALASTMRLTLQIDGNPYFVMVNVDLPPSVDALQTRRALARVERLVEEEGSELVVWHYTTTGRQRSPNTFPVVGQQYGQIKIGFHNRTDVFDRVPAFLDRLRQHLGDDPAVVDFSLQLLRGGPPSGRDIDVWVRGRDLTELDQFVDVLSDHLRQRPGVLDVRVSSGRGADALKVQVDPEKARRYGLSVSDVAVAARASMAGLPSIEISDHERNTPVRVMWAGGTALGLEQVGDLPLVTTDGLTMRLRQVATVYRVAEPQRIDRVDRQRAVRISATVDPDVSTPEREQVSFDAIYTKENARFPSVDIFVGGALADSQESFSQLPVAALVSGLLIFVVLAIQFRSYVQPLIILSAVPLGMAGVVLGLFCVGMDLSFIALIGAVGLIGIVVNDSLVLVDFINRARKEGASAREAAMQGGLLRLRPILVTTVTTVGGLAPLGLGVMGREPLLAPMAASIGFGLAFATALTLIAIPVIYLIIDDVAAVFRWGGSGGSTPTE